MSTKQKQIKVQDARGNAILDYQVDESTNKLESDVLVSYVPLIPSENRRPGVIKLPRQLMEQLAGFPLEMHGVPIDMLIKCAQYISQQAKRAEENDTNISESSK